MSEPLVQVKVHGSAGTIILNRPEKRNALNRPLLAELTQAIGDLHLERRVRAVILIGAGTAFSAGLDLDEMCETAQTLEPLARWAEDSLAYRDVLLAMLRLPKPIIAAVNGPAVAGGAGLVLASDIVLGTDEASFGMTEPRRGLVAGVVSPLLAFRLGGGQAARLLLTSAMIDAQEAFDIGLYHELVSGDKLWARAFELTAECARGAPEALQLTKRMLNETIGEHLTTLLAAGAAASATACTTEAAEEGRSAFLEKREPKWK